MFITKSKNNNNDIIEQIKALDEIICSPTDQEVRPCEKCKDICSCDKKSQFCCCDCTVDCEKAPRKLSSEPERYPIEINILPLVYELSTLRYIEPCWSCEGHIINEKLDKTPQVWFYSDSEVYVKLLNDYFFNMFNNRLLSSEWEIVVSVFQNDINSTQYILRPKITSTSKENLDKIHRDIKKVSIGMNDGIKNLAVIYLKKLQNLPK